MSERIIAVGHQRDLGAVVNEICRPDEWYRIDIENNIYTISTTDVEKE